MPDKIIDQAYMMADQVNAPAGMEIYDTYGDEEEDESYEPSGDESEEDVDLIYANNDDAGQVIDEPGPALPVIMEDGLAKSKMPIAEPPGSELKDQDMAEDPGANALQYDEEEPPEMAAPKHENQEPHGIVLEENDSMTTVEDMANKQSDHLDNGSSRVEAPAKEEPQEGELMNQ